MAQRNGSAGFASWTNDECVPESGEQCRAVREDGRWSQWKKTGRVCRSDGRREEREEGRRGCERGGKAVSKAASKQHKLKCNQFRCQPHSGSSSQSTTTPTFCELEQLRISHHSLTQRRSHQLQSSRPFSIHPTLCVSLPLLSPRPLVVVPHHAMLSCSPTQHIPHFSMLDPTQLSGATRIPQQPTDGCQASLTSSLPVPLSRIQSQPCASPSPTASSAPSSHPFPPSPCTTS